VKKYETRRAHYGADKVMVQPEIQTSALSSTARRMLCIGIPIIPVLTEDDMDLMIIAS